MRTQLLSGLAIASTAAALWWILGLVLVIAAMAGTLHLIRVRPDLLARLKSRGRRRHQRKPSWAASAASVKEPESAAVGTARPTAAAAEGRFAAQPAPADPIDVALNWDTPDDDPLTAPVSRP